MSNIPIVFNRTLLFDGSHALHRNLSEPNTYEMRNQKGKRTGGIFGVLRTILKEFKTFNYFPIVVFDGGLSKRRLDIYPNYKRTLDKQLLRESLEPKTEEQLLDEEYLREYATQRNDLIELLPLFGIPVIRIDGWEGDDLLYILTKMSKDSVVVSDDKDLIQLVTEPSVQEDRRCRVRRGMRDEFITYDYLKENGINIKEYVWTKAICGDNSDNIPSSCYQVGEKTALGLIKLIEGVATNTISKFPTDEKELETICNKLNISKRKAYLNYDENQFLTNLLLMDLSLVDEEVDEHFINNLYIDVLAQSQILDVKEIINRLNEFDISTFDYNKLVERVNMMKHCLKIEDLNYTEQMSDTNKPSNMLF